MAKAILGNKGSLYSHNRLNRSKLIMMVFSDRQIVRSGWQRTGADRRIVTETALT